MSEVQLLAPPWYDLDKAFSLLQSPSDDVIYDFAQAVSEEGRLRKETKSPHPVKGARLGFWPGRSLHEVGLRLAKEAGDESGVAADRVHDIILQASPFQQHLMASAPAAWPLRKALKRVQEGQRKRDGVLPALSAPFTRRRRTCWVRLCRRPCRPCCRKPRGRAGRSSQAAQLRLQ